MLLTPEGKTLLSKSKERGWVLEPDAKKILADAGLNVPAFRYAQTEADALKGAAEMGYPLVAKIVSPKALHKSDVGGVVVGIETDETLQEVFKRFSRFEEFLGIHLEEMASGLELIVGAKIDPQFGPVVLMGMGGTSVEIYQDTAVRMAPITVDDVLSMVNSLKARRLMQGYRGTEAINIDDLALTMITFSELVMEMRGVIESVDLNPVMCTARTCVIADARIMMK